MGITLLSPGPDIVGMTPAHPAVRGEGTVATEAQLTRTLPTPARPCPQ